MKIWNTHYLFAQIYVPCATMYFINICMTYPHTEKKYNTQNMIVQEKIVALIYS